MAIAAKILAIHNALTRANTPHAFGGALALAWCTEHARGTIDIDVNVFATVDQAQATLDALPEEVAWSTTDRELLIRDGQIRLWWDATPVDVFMNTTHYHELVANRVRWEEFEGASVPFLACSDLAVFKAFFNRTKDWADLEEIHAAGLLDVDRVVGVLVRYLGADDERVSRLLSWKPTT